MTSSSTCILSSLVISSFHVCIIPVVVVVISCRLLCASCGRASSVGGGCSGQAWGVSGVRVEGEEVAVVEVVEMEIAVVVVAAVVGWVGPSRYRVISPILPFVPGRFASGRFVPVSGSFRPIQNLTDSESFRSGKWVVSFRYAI